MGSDWSKLDLVKLASGGPETYGSSEASLALECLNYLAEVESLLREKALTEMHHKIDQEVLVDTIARYIERLKRYKAVAREAEILLNKCGDIEDDWKEGGELRAAIKEADKDA